MQDGELISATGSQRTRFGEPALYPEGLWRLKDGVYAWMFPNGCWYESNAGLIVGDGESLLVDTLSDLPLTERMLRAMAPVTRNAPIRHLVNTHADGDHIWGNQLLTDVEILMTAAADREARAVKPAMLRLMGQAGAVLRVLPGAKNRKIGRYLQTMVQPYDFRGVKLTTATRTFTGRLNLDVGGREVRLLEVGPAHTQGDALVHVPDAKTVFCGDLLFVGSTPVMWAGPVENWISALDLILAMDVETIVPGHGPVCDKNAVWQVRQYWEYVQREAGRRFAQGLGAPDAARDIALGDDFARQPFSRWDSSERIMTNVHIMHRHFQHIARHLRTSQKLRILLQQAVLAYELPHSAPASMHRLGKAPEDRHLSG